AAEPPASVDTEKAWAHAIDAYQQGDAAPIIRDLGSEAALSSSIADHARYLVADALERRGDLMGARAMAISVADRHPRRRLALRALRVVADGAQRLGRYEVAARAIELALKRAPADKRAGLQVEQARVLARAGDKEKDASKAKAFKEKALAGFTAVSASGLEAE